MPKRIILVTLSFLAALAMLFYLIWGPERGKEEELDLNSITDEVRAEIKANEEYAKKASEYMGDENGEIAYFYPPEDAVNHGTKKEKKKDVVKYFIAGLIANDVDIFISSFYPETISRDLFAKDNPDKDAVAKEIMDKITRSGQLQKVEYGERKGALKQDSNTITLIFTYKDGKKSDTRIDILPLVDAHHEGDKDAIYVITSSAWEIIDQIEKSTNS